jgi:large subunit ribosomal protein L21
MFAVIKTGGKQYRVQKGDVLEVEKLDLEEGKKVTFEEVLLVEDNGNTLVGTPLVDKARVLAVIVESFKGEKVIVFKKKRRKQYKKKRGHRQELTKVKIEDIVFGDKALTTKKPAEKAEPPKEKEATPKPKPEAKVKAEKAIEKEKPAKPVEKKAKVKKPEAKAAQAKPKEKKTETKTKPKVKKETGTKE